MSLLNNKKPQLESTPNKDTSSIEKQLEQIGNDIWKIADNIGILEQLYTGASSYLVQIPEDEWDDQVFSKEYNLEDIKQNAKLIKTLTENKIKLEKKQSDLIAKRHNIDIETTTKNIPQKDTKQQNN